ncbi:P-loop containing nucleoside triphosphate hydrolase protein [Mycena galopus ATCC 62051]|nr:P-loop containing nucleoside triphosphate hydrolase protein [Mycena galopus ATCC 62051]
MGYTLPTESPRTQRQAFERIVTLTTLLPGLRLLFLHSNCMQSIPISKNDISGLWDHPDGFLDSEWLFWRSLAATCLSDTSISAILEQAPVSQLANCLHDNGGLSVIERLLIAHGCETGTDSPFYDALCIRYLAGILQLPGFWLKIGSVHSDVARKLCLKMVRVLEDIALDTLPSEPSPTPELPFDYEGLDLLAETMLVGISSWFRVIDATDWALQSWYPVFRQAVHLWRRPLSAALLPNSFSRASSDTLERDIPTTYCQAEFDVSVETSTKLGATSPVAGLYYSEDIDESGEEPRPPDSASPEHTVVSSGPRGRMINRGLSFRNTEFRREFNVAVLGSLGTGKTALTLRFIHDMYQDRYDPSIEEVYDRDMMVDGQLSSLNVLDTAGVEAFRNLNEVYMKSHHGFILVFSLTQQAGLRQVDRLRKQIYQVKGSESVPIVVAGTKSNLVSEREVPAATLESLAREWNIPFYETSAEHNWHVNDVFEDLVRQMRQRYPLNSPTGRKQKTKAQGPCIIM